MAADLPDAVVLEVRDAIVRVEDGWEAIVADRDNGAALASIAITSAERQLETRCIVFEGGTAIVDVVV